MCAPLRPSSQGLGAVLSPGSHPHPDSHSPVLPLLQLITLRQLPPASTTSPRKCASPCPGDAQTDPLCVDTPSREVRSGREPDPQQSPERRSGPPGGRWWAGAWHREVTDSCSGSGARPSRDAGGRACWANTKGRWRAGRGPGVWRDVPPAAGNLDRCTDEAVTRTVGMDDVQQDGFRSQSTGLRCCNLSRWKLGLGQTAAGRPTRLYSGRLTTRPRSPASV